MMSTAKNDFENYRKMSEPLQTVEEADEALKNFYQAIEEARKKFRIMDVHNICKINVVNAGIEKSAMVSAHFGNTLEGAPMCAWAFAEARDELNSALSKIVKQEAE